MKIKLDENLPHQLATLLKNLGHEVHTFGVTLAALSFPSTHSSGHRMVHFEFGQARFEDQVT